MARREQDEDIVEEQGGESYRAGQGITRLGDRLAARQAPVPRRVLRPAADDEMDEEAGEGQFLRSKTRIKVRRGLIPETVWGKMLAAVVLLAVITGLAWGAVMVHQFFLHDPRFFIDTAEEIQIDGNTHVSRAQLLNIFGEDIGRNLFRVPLDERRSDLEALPWVEHATVMRLLPNRLRVRVVERRPVAFVRQGGRIGLVDAAGVLLDLPTGDNGGEHYSFPVLTGVDESEPLTTRAARMKIYMQFIKALDAGGMKVSDTLSEVDISDPDDVKAMIPDHTSEVQVHFGAEDYLARYQKYEQQLPVWRGQYPNLSSVDMRYPNQVVLEMAPGTGGAVSAPLPVDAGAQTASAVPSASVATAAAQAPAAVPAPTAIPVAKPAAPAVVTAKPTSAPAKSAATNAKPTAAAKAPAAPEKAAAVKAPSAAKPQASAVKAPPPTAKSSAGSTQAAAATIKAPAKPAVISPAAAQAADVRAANEKAMRTAKPASSAPAATATPATGKYSLDHPLMQPFDVPAKKSATVKAKPTAAKSAAKPAAKKPVAKKPAAKAKAKPAAKKKSVVKSNQPQTTQ